MQKETLRQRNRRYVEKDERKDWQRQVKFLTCDVGIFHSYRYQ